MGAWLLENQAEAAAESRVLLVCVRAQVELKGSFLYRLKLRGF